MRVKDLLGYHLSVWRLAEFRSTSPKFIDTVAFKNMVVAKQDKDVH